MKKIISLCLCFVLCLPLFTLTSCGQGNTLTVRLSSGVTATLSERPIPFLDTSPSHWYQESMFEQEKREKNPRDSVYLVDCGGELIAYLERPSYLDVLMAYHGYFAGHDMGEWGGGVTFYSYWDGAATEVSGEGLVAFVTDRDRYLYEKGYLLTKHHVYLLEEEQTKESDGPVWTPIVYVEGPIYRITGGAMWDGLLYYTTNQGLYRYEDGESVLLPAACEGFWGHANAYGMAITDNKIYVTTIFGIYEYDIETGEERLYTLLCEEFAEKK